MFPASKNLAGGGVGRREDRHYRILDSSQEVDVPQRHGVYRCHCILT